MFIYCQYKKKERRFSAPDFANSLSGCKIIFNLVPYFVNQICNNEIVHSGLDCALGEITKMANGKWNS